MVCLKCKHKIEATELAHHGLHLKCFREYFGANAPTEFNSLQRKSSLSSDNNENISITPQNTSFFHGKFKKYSAELGNESYIFKMRQAEAPEIPEVEYLCNQIGKSLGIPVAKFFYIDFNEDKIFVTKNFTKPAIAPMDLQHIYHFTDDQHSCEGIINAIANQTKRPHDVKNFIKTVLFDALIGNHDRHGRNLGFIVTAKNTSLSPIYDNVSYLSLESGNMLKADFNPTGRINTLETHEPSMRHYVKEFKRLGYRDILIEFHQHTKLTQLEKLIDESFCTALMKNALKKLIKKRFKELEDELPT